MDSILKISEEDRAIINIRIRYFKRTVISVERHELVSQPLEKNHRSYLTIIT